MENTQPQIAINQEPLSSQPAETASPAPTVPTETIPPSTTQQPGIDSGESPVCTNTISNKKKAAYFLVGLFFNIAVFVPIILWLLLKVKENKKPRFLSYVFGVVTALVLLVIGNLVFSPLVKQQLIKQFPEMGYIPASLSAYYPEAEFTVGLEYNQDMIEGEWEKHSTLTVNIQSDQELTAEDIKVIGQQTCDVLELNNDTYDVVVVQHGKSGGFLFFSYEVVHLAGAASCPDWREKSTDELVFRLPSPPDIIEAFSN